MSFVITRDQERHSALSRGFNQRWVADPDRIEMVTSTQDVVTAVGGAIRDDNRISIRSGGHCYESFVCNPEADVIIDVSLLESIYYDDTMHAYCVGSGATNWQIYTHLYRPYGLVLPGGSCYSVGAGGHISGGGYGLLSRQLGLTVDYLSAIEVVVAQEDESGWPAQAVIASPNSADTAKRELFWAHTGGGGGNFGVITKYWFRGLNSPPENVVLSGASIPWSALLNSATGEQQFRRLVENFGSFFEDHSAPGDDYNTLFAILKLTHRSKEKIAVVVQADEEDGRGQEKVDYFYERLFRGTQLPTHDFDFEVGEHSPSEPLTIQGRTMPWFQATQTLNGSGDNQRGKYKSAHHRKSFSSHQIGEFWRYLSDSSYDNPEGLVQIDSYGGEVNRPDASDTAVAQRDSALKVQYQVYWPSQSSDERHIGWLRSLYYAVYSDKDGVPISDDDTDGCYVNYPDVDLNDTLWNRSDYTWAELYYKDNYPDLRRIKSRWDPDNVFRHAQSIEPAD